MIPSLPPSNPVVNVYYNPPAVISDPSKKDTRVARVLPGYFTDGDYNETIQIEYRYDACSPYRNQWVLHTCIHGQVYHIPNGYFFGAVSDLLDQLPPTSAIMIPHRVLVTLNGRQEITTLEEWLYPYTQPTGGTVVYQLKLQLGNQTIETPKQNFGYLVIDFGSAMESLRPLLGDSVHLKVCYFCQYLVEYNEFGGTDYRHDQLYCFRDDPDTLSELMQTYPRLKGRETLLTRGTSDMDALHSCCSFTYRTTPRP